MALRIFVNFANNNVIRQTTRNTAVYCVNSVRFLSNVTNVKEENAEINPNYEFIGNKSADFNKIVDLSAGLPQPLGKEQNSKLNYTKLDNKSHIMTSYMVNVKSKKRREKAGKILLEGKRLIEDAVNSGHMPEAVFFSRISDAIQLKLNEHVKLYSVPYKSLQLWSDVSTTPGIIGIFPIPDTSKFEGQSALPLTVICDNIRDPGNLGVILRTSAAVGCTQLLLTNGCVDLWEPKVLRSSSGAHFRMRISKNLRWEDIEEIVPEASQVYLADSDVPTKIPEEREIDVYELSEQGEKVAVVDSPFKRFTTFQKRHSGDSNLPLLTYDQADYATADSLVLVIGGETEGLSEDAFKMAASRKGSRVFLPLENGVESLNSGTALGILAYEMRRQRQS